MVGMELGLNRSVTLESDALHVQVYPQIGGKVASIVDKADGYELLYNFPDEIPTTYVYDSPYSEHWFAGWDECFPSIAPSPYVGHPYDGIVSPDHGELWGLPTTAVPTNNGITTVWHGLRFGYRLVRKLVVHDASVIATYTLVNLSPFPFRFVWAMHALMSSKSPVELDLGPIAMRKSHRADGKDAAGEFAWPMWDKGVDLSHPVELPGDWGWKSFSDKPIAAPATIKYAARGRAVKIAYESEQVAAHWGVWINTGGWLHHQHFAIEPTAGRSDHLDRAIRDGSAGRVDASGSVEWSVRLTVAPLA
jgi:hypothetical protein